MKESITSSEQSPLYREEVSTLVSCGQSQLYCAEVSILASSEQSPLYREEVSTLVSSGQSQLHCVEVSIPLSSEKEQIRCAKIWTPYVE